MLKLSNKNYRNNNFNNWMFIPVVFIDEKQMAKT